MSKGKEAEARKSLERLRGAKHVGIIEAELFRIAANLQMMKEWDQEDSKEQAQKKKNKHILTTIKEFSTDVGFLKPFGILLFVFCIGLEWTGLVAVAFYLLPILM